MLKSFIGSIAYKLYAQPLLGFRPIYNFSNIPKTYSFTPIWVSNQTSSPLVRSLCNKQKAEPLQMRFETLNKLIMFNTSQAISNMINNQIKLFNVSNRFSGKSQLGLNSLVFSYSTNNKFDDREKIKKAIQILKRLNKSKKCQRKLILKFFLKNKELNNFSLIDIHKILKDQKNRDDRKPQDDLILTELFILGKCLLRNQYDTRLILDSIKNLFNKTQDLKLSKFLSDCLKNQKVYFNLYKKNSLEKILLSHFSYQKRSFGQEKTVNNILKRNFTAQQISLGGINFGLIIAFSSLKTQTKILMLQELENIIGKLPQRSYENIFQSLKYLRTMLGMETIRHFLK